MKRRVVCLALLAAAGCTGITPAVPDGSSSVRFDIDVAVDSMSVTLWFREHFATGCAPEEIFPRPGECASYTDAFGCGPMIFECLTAVSIERGGTLLAKATAPDLGDWWHYIGLSAPTLFAEPGATLVIEGCGGVVTLPLPSVPAPAPTLAGLTTDGTSLFTEWTSAGGPTGIYTLLSGGFNGDACHESASGPGRVGPLSPAPTGGSLYLASVEGYPPRPTPWGEAHVWNVGWAAKHREVAIPGPVAPGSPWWTIGPGPEVMATVTIDGSSEPAYLPYWSFRSGLNGVRLELHNEWLSYTADDNSDTLRVALGSGTFSATFPHIAPTDDLDLSVPGNDQTVALAIGPVTLVNEGDPMITKQVTLTAGWEHPLIVLPSAP